MDKPSEMSVFVEVARKGSFSAAARRLQLSPSAVSKLITRMEERLGSRLFNRTTRKLSLTEGGQRYFTRCVEILVDIDTAEDLLAGYQQAPKGELSVSCSPGFARFQLLPMIPRFLEQYPQLDLNLQTSGEKVDLVSHNIDVAIRLGKLKDSSLVARKLGGSHRIVCASPDYLKTHGTPKKPDDLLNHNCLTIAADSDFNRWALNRGSRQKIVAVSGNLVSNSVDSLYEMALQGQGIINLAEFIVGPELRSGRLVPLFKGYKSDSQQVHAVYPHRLHLPAKVRVFIDFLVAEFAALPSWKK